MMLKKLLIKLSQKNSIGFLVILLGSLTWILTMVRSGICMNPYCLDGRNFWGPNGHDGIWHIALAEGFLRESWNIPVFAGEALKNYHIGFDILLSLLSKLTTIPVISLYFQVLPTIFSLLTGVFLYKFVLSWTRSISQAFWATFFVYFGGSFGWVVTLFKDRVIGGESVFWSQQAISTLVNPPFALSIIVMFSAFYLLDKGLKENNNKFLTVSAVLLGTLVQIKIYAGILSLLALFMGALWQMFIAAFKKTQILNFKYKLNADMSSSLGNKNFVQKDREDVIKEGLVLFKVFLTAFVVSIIIFPVVDFSNATLVFKPFWFLETMMFLNDRVGWQKFGEAMVNYKTGGIWVKFIAAYLLAFLIFVLGNLGTRILAIPYLIRKIRMWKSIDYFDVMITTIIIVGILIPLFFVQEGTPWNTIQFVYYSLVFTGTLAGIGFSKFIENSKLNTSILYSIEVLIVILTLPTTVGTLLYVYLPARPPSYVSSAEIEALHFLSGRPKGTVLTYPYDPVKAKEAETNPPRPLYLYESTAYVSALSKHDVYLEDEVNLNITKYDWKTRKREIEDWLKETNAGHARDFLVKNNITYIYWIKEEYDDISQRAFLGESQLGLTRVFENNKVIILQVN